MLKSKGLLTIVPVVLAMCASSAKADPFGFVFGASPNPVHDLITNEYAYTYNLTLAFDSTSNANAGGFEEMTPGQTITVPNFFGYAGGPIFSTLVGLSGPGSVGSFVVTVDGSNNLIITDTATAEAGPTTSTANGNPGTISTLKWAFTAESLFALTTSTTYTGLYTTKASSSSGDPTTFPTNTGTVMTPNPNSALPTPEPWNFVSAFATFIPVGMLYLGLRRRKQASQPVVRG
jgi:hypothetical protein